MAGRFHIPSAKEMQKDSLTSSEVKPLFKKHLKVATSKTGISYERPSSASENESSKPVSKAAGNISTTNNISTSNSEKTQAVSSAETSAATTTASTSNTRPTSTNSVLVSQRQRGNPILKHIRNIPWEFSDIVPDYQVGQTSCALFLSLRYHQLKPEYIHERLKQLGHSYNLRVLLVLVDISDPHSYLKDLAKIAILADCTLVVAFNTEEAGFYLETFKSFENKPPDLIMERTEGNPLARLTDCLTKVRSVNKTDASTLLSTFGSFENIAGASEEDLSLCPGFGPQKAKRLFNVFHEPFVKSKKVKPIDEAKVGETSGVSGKK